MSYENWKVKIGKETQPEYSQVADWCDNNGYVIIEDKGYYKTQPIPQPTQEELDQEERQNLLRYLEDTDYVVIKIAEGEATAEDYADILQKRKQARARISEIDGGK